MIPCAFLLLLAACILLGGRRGDDSPVFLRWREGWLPLGLALLFTSSAYGAGVGVLVWFGLLAPAAVCTAFFLACSSRVLRERTEGYAAMLSRLLFFPAVLCGIL